VFVFFAKNRSGIMGAYLTLSEFFQAMPGPKAFTWRRRLSKPACYQRAFRRAHEFTLNARRYLVNALKCGATLPKQKGHAKRRWLFFLFRFSRSTGFCLTYGSSARLSAAAHRPITELLRYRQRNQ